MLEKGFFKDTKIGDIEIDISRMYFKNDDHCIHNQWVALTNDENQDPNSIVGQIKMSVCIQGPGDSQVKLTDQDKEKSEKEILLPSSIRRTYKQVEIGIV